MNKKKLFLVGALVIVLIGIYFIIESTPKTSVTNNKDLEIIEAKNFVSLEGSITSNSIEKLVSKGLTTFYTRDAESIIITETIIEDEDVFVSFTLEENEYTGFMYATFNNENYNLEDFFLNRNLNKTDKIVTNELVGSINGEVIRNYKIIGGTINDTNIDSIHIFYPNADYIIIKLDDTQNTFMHVNKGYTESPQRIIGYDGDDELYYWENFN
ncbi:hypothetical protein [Sutcliffiella sp. NC1]|uniref:hypothetical protein n=1 Tax=Sutcliffiella sp. NC1 TaxID=3004096 RepID=UPI0022DD6C27|nr:hypothetical protein [Sutcliffiella sp. NC1]WBL15109.1 hypothetical protein O1A01_25160 [Sutcliffiella sp. NC1]